MSDKWRSRLRDKDLRLWVILGAVLAAIAIGCASLVWFTIVVPFFEPLHSHR